MRGFCNLSVRLPSGCRWRKCPFSGHPKTTFFLLAMVIGILMTIASKKMTIAATPKPALGRAANRAEKGAEYPCFVKDGYFCGPRGVPRWPRWPPKRSWFDDFSRKLRPGKWVLRLHIYAKAPLVLHKYTAVCKGFSMARAMTMAATASVPFAIVATAIPV